MLKLFTTTLNTNSNMSHKRDNSTLSTPDNQSICYIIFEEYLQPKAADKTLQAAYGTQKLLQLQILQHPLLQTKKYQRHWRTLMLKLKQYRFRLPAQNVAKHTPPRFKAAATKVIQHLRVKQQIMEIDARMAHKSKCWRDYAKYLNLRKDLPGFLHFLRARNDEHLCKRKTGFEIYCELASIHGFINFVGAKTWQRVFWCLVVCLAIFMSIVVLVMSHVMNVNTPTILYTESTTYPAWRIRFPAVTICNMNRISRSGVTSFFGNSTLTAHERETYLRHFLDTADQLYYTARNFLPAITPNCANELLRCSWQGRLQSCSELFRRIETPQGSCCAFNYHALEWHRKITPQHTNSCGYKMGLSVLLAPNITDYLAAASKTAGYQVLIHAPHDYPVRGVPRHLVQARSEAAIKLTPRSTYATAYVSGLSLERRRCYLPGEYQLKLFVRYSQTNCLAECRSKMIFEHCGCVPPLLPRHAKWATCTLAQLTCVVKYKNIFKTFLIPNEGDYKTNHYAENFICDCFPSCEFNQYVSNMDWAPLNRNYSIGGRKFFKNIQITNHTLLHVFFGDLTAERLRLDVYENWLTFVGTFGGITGLHMGYSFVSGFEMIFFVFVRPACNWLTRKQIRYRLKRRQKKVAAEEAKKEQMKLQQEKSKSMQNESIRENVTNRLDIVASEPYAIVTEMQNNAADEIQVEKRP